MGMYTKLKYSLLLKELDAEGVELLEWLQKPYIEGSVEYKPFPSKYTNYAFFSKGRKGWFTDLQFTKLKEDYTVKGWAELKNYESQIGNLFEMLAPLIVSGEYHSLYEEFDTWYDHIKDDWCQ
jgi:hypothetical protein